jgi:(heptosyl)LPS beta-1,4-glucosyltransferase
MKITATIITLNEERNIARAIESLRCCDEILIVDSGSVDRTV